MWRGVDAWVKAGIAQVRKCQDAQAFKWVKIKNKKTGEDEDKLEPCSPGDAEGANSRLPNHPTCFYVLEWNDRGDGVRGTTS
jgi:hypothetical protein